MGTTFKIRRIVGAEKALSGMIAFGGVLEKKAEKALTDEANNILKDSMDECPVKTGTMRRSGTVEDPKVSAKGITVEIGFNTAYAAPVHENLKAHHDVGKAKFLEDPINAAAPGLPARIAARIRF